MTEVTGAITRMRDICGISVGDIVQILGKLDSNDRAVYGFFWNPSMDGTVGDTSKVVNVSSYGFKLENGWTYPFWLLEKAISGSGNAQQRGIYADFQEVMEFKEGDCVRVMRSAESNEMGWDNSWLEEMDEFIGQTGVIEGIGINGITISFDGYVFGFPAFVLERRCRAALVEVVIEDPYGRSVLKLTKEFYSELEPILDKMKELYAC